VLSFSNVVDLFANELARLCRGALSLPPVASRTLDRSAFWHGIISRDE
jgi:hypothetical protein